MKRFSNNHIKRIISCLAIFSLLMTTVFSSISIKGATIEYWDGTAATEFAGGEGTSDNPFLIENGGQLYKAVKDLGKKSGGTAAYYKLTKDIYLNKGYENYKNWGTTAPSNNWSTIYSSNEFIGHLDGDCYTIYGLYNNRTSHGAYFGMIPRINGGATVENLIISNAYVRNRGDATGFITGRIIAGTVSNCVVKNSAIGNTANDVIGGISGTATSASATISNCATYDITNTSTGAHGGILGKAWSGVCTVKNCFSAGNFPFEETGSISCSGTYTDISGSKNGVTVIQNSKMQGAQALENMKLSSDIWMATSGYPIIYKDLNAGLTWDGKTASAFAGGNGTINDPYLIENGGQLFKAISDLGKMADGTAAYYLITADIYLNKNSNNYANWGNVAPKNNWLPTRGDFIGHLDGGYHTIYGLYSVTNAWRNGLIPYMNSGATVSNLIIAKAYIHNGDSNAAAIVGTMYNNTKVDSCLVYDTVVSAGSKDIGGIVGSAAVNTVTISNCGTYNLTLKANASAGGILGRSWQNVSGANGVRVLNCFSVDNFPVGDTNRLWADSTYTNASGTKGGVIKIEKEKMQGEGAVANMKLSKAIWKDTEGYPTLIAIKEVAGDIWSGIAATRFAGGIGTESDPYLIETPSQLYKAVSELGKNPDGKAAHYLITADIYLNKDHQNYASWGETPPANNWIPINSNIDFIGHIDGDGHTIYGLYINKNVWCAGLIARAKGANIRDINIANSYIYSVGGTVGGVVGMAYEGTDVSRCKVYDTVIVDQAATDLGGIVGAAKASVMITACASYNLNTISTGAVGGILGRAWSSAYVRESYSIGNFPIGQKEVNRMGCINNYTDSNTRTKDGVTVLKTSDMKGADALSKMQLNTSYWKADANGYPVFKEYDNGKNGEIWSGGIAEYYAGGDGTKENPYLIESGEQLYKLVYENCIPGSKSKYYKVTTDIRLNNTDDKNWYERNDVNKWHVVKVYSFSFAGHFDGNGHTVAGITTSSESGNAYTGLIPVLEAGSSVKDIGIVDSYIATSSSIAENFTGSVVGWIDNWDASLPVTEENTPVISGCFADKTVTLSGMYCGGILSGVSAPVLVENCYFTGNFDNYASAACIVGNTWTQGTKISHCYAANSEMKSFASGQSVQRNELTFEACYNFGKGSGVDFSFVSLYDIRGEKAAKTLSRFDFENIWKTVDGGTPVLKVYGDRADTFSFKDEVYSTVRFVTNVAGMSLAPLKGKIDSPITLPKPTREGYDFAGWYVYSELQCEYKYDTFPFIDLILYAKWEPKLIAQDFESYPNTDYDLDEDYVYFRPGVMNYDGANVHSGNKGIKRLGNSSERQDFLVKYETELTVGKEYTVSFWMMTGTEGATGKVSMLNATWPDIAEPVLGKEVTIAEYNNLSSGKWVQYRYKFTALTPWISFRTDGDTELYFDDILIYPNN